MADHTSRSGLDALPQLASHAADAHASFVIAGDGRDVLWANGAAAALLGENLQDGQLIDGVARQFGRLPVPSRGFKLMRLTLDRAGSPLSLTCRAERIAVGETNAALVSVLDAPAPPPEAVAPVDIAPVAAPAAATPEPEAAVSVAAPATRPVRFAWQSDADGTITTISPDWRALLSDEREVIGRNWGDLAQAHGFDPEGRLMAALARQETWSGVTVDWPLADGAGLSMELAGLPVFDRSRAFQGFRGFGVGRMTEATAQAAEPVEAEETATDIVVPALPDPAEALAADAAPTPEREAEIQSVEERPLEDETLSRSADAEAEVSGDVTSAAASEAEASHEDDENSGQADLFEDTATAPADTLDAADAGETGTSAEAPAPEEDLPQISAPAPVLLPFRIPGRPNLKPSEHSAFQQIARVLGAQLPPEFERPVPVEDTAPEPPIMLPQTPPVADLATPASHDAETVLEALGTPALVHRGGRALFANDAFFSLLEVDDLAALDAFGVDNLFDARAEERHGDEGGVWLRMPDNRSQRVDARLKTVFWAGEAASLTFVTPIVPAAPVQEGRTERELRAILDTATDGVLVLDARGRIVSINRSGEALFGYEAAELEGRSFTLLLGADSHRAAVDYLDGIRGNGVASVLNDGRHVVGVARRGGLIPLFFTLGRISEGEEERFCAVLRDLTQFRKTEEELRAAKTRAEQASEQKSAFLARVSHEIRTPLNAVLGFAELMMEERFGPLGNDRYRDYLRDIHESGAHIISLINDLLDLSKVEAGKLDMNFTGINLNDVVANAVALLQPQANRNRIIIRTSLAPRLPAVVGDARSLKQIALNLLSNAVKYTPAGGQIIMSTALTDLGQAVIRVRDTGLGMSDSEIAVALEPFRQLSTTSAAGSTGLGLPLTKALVEANRATFAIQSAVGTGTLVEVIFPPTRVLAD